MSRYKFSTIDQHTQNLSQLIESNKLSIKLYIETRPKQLESNQNDEKSKIDGVGMVELCEDFRNQFK